MTKSFVEFLPPHLAERTRVWHGQPGEENSDAGRCVLYWMSSAVRAHENPALDVAVLLANKLSLPLLVCQELSEEHPYASDRHFVFEMQGARDVQLELADANIKYIFHVRRQSDPSMVGKLAAEAVCIVIEDMPVPSEVAIKKSMLSNANMTVLCVDTACILPMELVGKAYTRAFSFRHATSKERTRRLKSPWAKQEEVSAPAFNGTSGTDLSGIDLSELNLQKYVLSLDIDHSIPPSPDTIGGAIEGYKRWDEFKNSGLKRYARDRNNPLLNPSSRLSSYLRLGHISPFRIAREAATSGAPGAYKFLDELLIWRELSYTFCRFSSGDLESLQSIPEWAQQTLSDHECDAREHIYSWATLARAKTENALWNAAQQSLLIRGELHNNLRMTWGKAFIPWTQDAGDALKNMIDINHRFALDGNDPSSYGGLLWCLGQFDRPFTPEKLIFGTVRPRPLAQHARRLNVEAYSNSVIVKRKQKVGIIGGGIAGLACAQVLQDQGFEVALFDKSMNAGGRLATRTTNREVEPMSFDHGAQYFTAKSSLFKRHVSSWLRDGAAAIWAGKIGKLDSGKFQPEERSHDRYVGTPGMRSIADYLARDLTISKNSRVTGLKSHSDNWLVTVDGSDHELEFDIIVLALPPAQAATLLSDCTDLSEQCNSIQMAPCWATMVAFDSRLDIDYDGLFVKNSSLSWIARDSSKPGRAEGERWVLHATPQWSEQNIEEPAPDVTNKILSEFFRVTRLEKREPVFAKSHRWRYAIPVDSPEPRLLKSPNGTLFVCGDWCHGARVEGAFLSGIETAAHLMYQVSSSDRASA